MTATAPSAPDASPAQVGEAAAESPGLRLPAARRRRQLFDVALETFSRRGFNDTSMDDIAEAAGVTKPVLYQHWRSKRALYLELLDYVGSELLRSIVEATSDAQGPRQRVEAGFAAYFHFVAERESAFRLLFGGRTPRDKEFETAVRRVEASIAGTVATLIDADIDVAHRQLLGHAVVGMAEGAGRQWLRSRSSGPGAGKGQLLPDEPDRLARRIADLAWAGLRVVHRD